jgi:hypothetical protein
MITYQLLKNIEGGEPTSVLRNGKDCIPLNAPDNTDYQAYLKWVADGNQPIPAEETL